MAKLPITRITVKVTDPALLTNTWGLFDLIIGEMEKPVGAEGMPILDAQGRKKFRVEVTRAMDKGDDPLEVFRRWVTLLVPEFVPLRTGASVAVVKQEGGVAGEVREEERVTEKATVEVAVATGPDELDPAVYDKAFALVGEAMAKEKANR